MIGYLPETKGTVKMETTQSKLSQHVLALMILSAMLVLSLWLESLG